MLVLSRRVADQVLIPSLGITVEVLSIKGNVVKLGISAPQDIRVLRGELIPNKAESESEPTENICESDATSPTPKRAPLRSYLNHNGNRTNRNHLVNGVNSKSTKLCIPDEARDCLKEARATYKVCV